MYIYIYKYIKEDRNIRRQGHLWCNQLNIGQLGTPAKMATKTRKA
jgi:hypothetical protein